MASVPLILPTYFLIVSFDLEIYFSVENSATSHTSILVSQLLRGHQSLSTVYCGTAIRQQPPRLSSFCKPINNVTEGMAARAIDTMDPLQSDDAAPDAQPNQVSEATAHHTTQPMRFPPEIMRMIFTEFLSKPAIHFASLRMVRIPKEVEDDEVEEGLTFGLTPWSNGDIESGYLAAQILNELCELSRDVARSATPVPAVIEFDNGPVSIDNSTDILCFVVPRLWARMWPTTYYDHQGIALQGMYNQHVAMKLGSVRRAGVLVTQKMWLGVLATWFVPKFGRDLGFYQRADGRLDTGSLVRMMNSGGSIKDFYLILPDITVDA